MDALLCVAERVRAYQARPISLLISGKEDMFARDKPNAAEHYLSVGRSAIDIIAQAMIAAGRTHFGSVLDLPCGGGRVTRHLRAFLPESSLFVAELDPELQAFTAEAFDAVPVSFDPLFAAQPLVAFDLIFVGSLLTHFSRDQIFSALNWFIESLTPNGILVVTTHGRRAGEGIAEQPEQYGPTPDTTWSDVAESYHRTGFGYAEQARSQISGAYGVSLCQPSWLLHHIETDARVRILSFQEAGWDHHQDVLVLQRNSAP